MPRALPGLKNRTWPVFLVGLGCLLLLIFLPGIAGLQQSKKIYEDVRAIQQNHEETQAALFDIERRILLMSVTVRDFLLDNSPETAGMYRRRFDVLRASVEEQLQHLAKLTGSRQTGMFDRLRSQLGAYADSIEPVFLWSPAERVAKATYFLREQQRPRRQTMLAIADEIGRLIEENYRSRYEEINRSQRTFRRQVEIAVGAAFLLGVAVAIATSFRISVLESHFERQRLATEQAEKELRSLSSRLMHAQEEERRRLSRELHDEVGQLLTALRIELGTLDKLRHDAGEGFDTHSSEAKSIAERALRTVRDMAVGLRPSVLDLGLVPALQWQARQFSRITGTEAAVSVEGQLPPLPEAYLTCIYRIVQEALTNSAKHARAGKVEIGVSATVSELTIHVRDDGVGFAHNWDAGRGLGLVGIEERARELNGIVTIQSEEQKGVGIEVRLPLSEGVVA